MTTPPTPSVPIHAVLDLLHAHRSIRRFAGDPVPDADLERAIAAGQMASTSSAIQAYCAIRVRDEQARRKLVELTGGQEKVAACGAFLVICGDARRHALAARREGLEHDARFEAFLLAAIDASLFCEKTCIALEAMGYGICYVGGLRNHLAEVDALLELPRFVWPLYGLCIGVPDEAPAPRPRLPVPSVLFEDRYPDDGAVLEQLDAYDETYSAYRVARGAEPGTWSGIMGRKFSRPERTDIAAYYASKGARLE